MTHKTPSKHILSPLRHVSRELVARFGSDSSHLRTDERGASAILGTMFAFALVVSVVAMVQVSAVPAWNQQTEFEHLQTVESDFATFDERIAKASSGTPSRASIEAGVDYPTRALFLSPAAGSGTIRTTEVAPATIRNARATDARIDYWNGDNRTYDSQMLIYQPDYNYLQSEPTLTHEGVVRYTQYESGEVGATQSLVDGNRISLVLLEGDVNVGAKEATTFSVVPASAGTDYVTVTDDGQPIEITVATRLSERTWNDLLESEPAQVSAYNNSTGTAYNLVTIKLDGGREYDLHISRVGIDTPGTVQEPEYIIGVAGNGAALVPDAKNLAIVEVRDAQNNPVANATVEASIGRTAANGTVTVRGSTSPTLTTTTDENGRATFVYRAPPAYDIDGVVSDSFDVSVKNRTSDATVDTVTFDVEIREGGPTFPPRGLRTSIDGPEPKGAYEDNGNRIWEPGVDTPINDSEILDGEYHAAPDKMLVIPANMGTIVAEEVHFSGGKGVSLHTDLVATKDSITIDGGNGPVYAIGTRLTTAGTKENADTGVFISTNDKVDLSGASVISKGSVSVSANEIRLDRAGLTSESSSGGIQITAPGSGVITARDSDISAAGPVSITGGSVDISGGGVSSTGASALLDITTTTDDLNLDGVVIDGDQIVKVTAETRISLYGGSISSANKEVTIVSKKGGLDGEEAAIATITDVDITVKEYIYIPSATIYGGKGVTIDVTSGGPVDYNYENATIYPCDPSNVDGVCPA